MDIKKEREAFNKEFGIDDADTFPAFSSGIESSAALKCNWLGWKKRAEIECKENPETIEIDGLKTIHKLCKFGAEHNMEGCSFTEIVERMFDELESAKAQAVPEGFVLVEKKNTEDWYLDDCEGMWWDHDGIDGSLCELDIGEVQAVEHKEYLITENNTLYATRVWDDANDQVDCWQFFKIQEEAEKAAAYCKARFYEESQEPSNEL